ISAIASVEENVDHQEHEEINLEEISQVQYVVLREKLFSINRLIANIESLKDNPTPVCVFNSSTSFPIILFLYPNLKLFAIIRKRREVENPLIPRPPPKPPDVETDAGKKIAVVMNDKDEDVDYSSFMFVIYPEMFPFLLFAESEDTIFDPEIPSG
nr:hypothetical protein [Tanacetum cinerariifolium]